MHFHSPSESKFPYKTPSTQPFISTTYMHFRYISIPQVQKYSSVNITEMGLKQAQVLFLLLTAASMVAVGLADKKISATQRWNFGFNYTDWFAKHQNNDTGSGPNRIIVGGSAKWQFGFNYTDWAMKNGPFYLNDTLVFKYDPPVNSTSHPHSVYLFTNFWSFLNCNLTQARRLADPTQGGGEGFEFRLKWWQPYFFACGESNGFHCDKGLMKFAIKPLIRRWHW